MVCELKKNRKIKCQKNLIEINHRSMQYKRRAVIFIQVKAPFKLKTDFSTFTISSRECGVYPFPLDITPRKHPSLLPSQISSQQTWRAPHREPPQRGRLRKQTTLTKQTHKPAITIHWCVLHNPSGGI